MINPADKYLDALSKVIAAQHAEMISLREKLAAADKTIAQMKADQIDEWESQVDDQTLDLFNDRS